MFCFNFGAIRAAGRMAQGVCCCLCLMVCGGPILLIVGIILLATPNTRADDVKQYNTDAALFNPSIVNNFNGSINGVTTSKITRTVTVDSGSDEGVDSFQSVFVQASVYTATATSSTTVTYDISNYASSGPYSPNFQTSKSGSATCRRSSGCYNSNADAICRDKYGSDASSIGGCAEDRSCSCQYNVYLETFCVVASPDPNNSSTYVTSPTYQSCYYPFKSSNDQVYTTSGRSSYTPFQLRLNTDPFIIMQKITKGDMDFGLTAAQQRKIAGACIGIGCVMIACIALVSFILFKVIKSFTDKKGDASQPMNSGNYSNPNTPHNNGGYPGQQYPPQQQQPAYGQPAYGQPAYGQPVAYGQPAGQQYPPQQQQPAYGQPAYGQSAGV